jgi:hypothetical protein
VEYPSTEFVKIAMCVFVAIADQATQKSARYFFASLHRDKPDPRIT